MGTTAEEDDESSSVQQNMYSDEDESGDVSSHTGQNKKSAENDSGVKIAAKETQFVKRWRSLLVAVLALVAFGVCTGTYLFVVNESKDDYKLSFKLFANSIETQFGHHVKNLKEAMGNLGDTISASADETHTFPFVKVDKFEVLAEHARARSRVESITYAPLVMESERVEWQNFSIQNQDWIEESRSTFLEHNELQPIYLPGRVPPFIYSRRDGIFPQEITPMSDDTIFAPVWYLSPPPFNPAIINFDLISNQEYQEIIQHVITNKEPNFSPIIDIERSLSLQVSDKDHLLYHEQFIDVEVGTGYDRPHTTCVHPVFESRKSNEISGIVVGVLAWDVYLADLVPEGVNGVIAVIRSTCGEDSTYTYELNGPKPTFHGGGDLHDHSFDSMVRHVKFFGSNDDKMPWLQSDASDNRSVCSFWVDLYPSNTFEEAYETDLPIFATVTVGGTFLIVALIFWVYDVLVGKRYAKVSAAAEKSTAVVNSLFPAEVRDRLMEAETRNDGTSEWPIPGKAKNQKKERIADLFPDVTILFCDIVGFTAWSSMREPCQVFELLESIYCEFDQIARRRYVFKVETIGDCYVACAGMPKPNKDHALVTTRFASDCLSSFTKLVKELEVTLGPDTGDLGVRLGLHSGPVTAGVLRGDRARFQLFGDAMNTASRIESNGARNRIHCSEETANLLIAAGKQNWLTAREDKIHAKGKGELQSYWIEPRGRRTIGTGSSLDSGANEQLEASESSNGNEGDDDDEAAKAEALVRKQRLCTKTQRLIEWNTELLEKLMKKITARHAALGITKGDGLPKFERKGNPIDEVVEIIALPEFDAKTQVHNQDVDSIRIPDSTIEDLRAFVSGIAAMYNENFFHSFEHGSHVTMSVSKLMSRITAPSELLDSEEDELDPNLAANLHDHTYGITSDPLTQFACLVSALIHDVDHQGVPNVQLSAENALVARAYHTSPAEQNSIDLAWTLLMEDQFHNLRDTICPTADEFARFRQLVVNAVMATDIMDKDLKALRNTRWESAFTECGKDEDPCDTVNRKATIVIEHLIQASDVAHTMQHWHIYRKWNERFFMECYAAYRNGRAEKDPSKNWYKGELGFFDFYIIPLAKKLKDCGVFGVSSDEYLKYAESNRAEWENRGQELVVTMLAKAQRE